MKRLIEAALTTSLVSGLPPFPPRAFRSIRGMLTGDLDTDRSCLDKLTPEFRASGIARLERLADFAAELERLESSGIHVFLEGDPGYPLRWLALGNSKPVVLFAAGAAEIFQKALVGVVGSRSPSEHSKSIASEIGKQAIFHGFGVVSGGAKGIDEIAVRSALNAGANCAVICADSMLKSCDDFGAEIASGIAAVCSPFSPHVSFSAGNAMARNKLIYRSSLITAAVEFTPGSGGTWTGAVEALKNGRDRVAVFESFAHARSLVELGAISCANIDDFFAQTENAFTRDLFADT